MKFKQNQTMVAVYSWLTLRDLTVRTVCWHTINQVSCQSRTMQVGLLACRIVFDLAISCASPPPCHSSQQHRRV